jgi:hypothetical protein
MNYISIYNIFSVPQQHDCQSESKFDFRRERQEPFGKTGAPERNQAGIAPRDCEVDPAYRIFATDPTTSETTSPNPMISVRSNNQTIGVILPFMRHLSIRME